MTDRTAGTWRWAALGQGSLAFDPDIGNLRALTFDHAGRRLSPLHTAQWAEDATMHHEPAVPPVERALSGDFFCAPFGTSDLLSDPPHGWSANSRWQVTAERPGILEARLERPVMGSTITKTLRLSRAAPLLYQTHTIANGDGGLTVAHHPMVRMAGRGRFNCSPKRAILTPDMPLEPGRNRLACGIRSVDLHAVPGAGGAPVDLGTLPIGTAHEDFVTLVEADGADLGWSAVLREEEDDIVFFLKDPRVLPVTMLWHSNGGRDYPPWNGRHTGVLGIEDGCAAGAAGHAAALGPNAVSREGVATCLALGPGRLHRVVHVIGALPRPEGWRCVEEIALDGAVLRIAGDRGPAVEMPFDAGFFDSPP